MTRWNDGADERVAAVLAGESDEASLGGDPRLLARLHAARRAAKRLDEAAHEERTTIAAAVEAGPSEGEVARRLAELARTEPLRTRFAREPARSARRWAWGTLAAATLLLVGWLVGRGSDRAASAEPPPVLLGDGLRLLEPFRWRFDGGEVAWFEVRVWPAAEPMPLEPTAIVDGESWVPDDGALAGRLRWDVRAIGLDGGLLDSASARVER